MLTKEDKRRIVYAAKRNSTMRDLLKRYPEASYQAIYQTVHKAGVKFKAKPWAKGYARCIEPNCPYTDGGRTSKPHASHGRCTSCDNKWFMRTHPDVRAKHSARGKEWRANHPEKMAEYRERHESRNPGSKRAITNALKRLSHARGFDSAFVRYTPVQVPWAYDYDGLPKTLRIVKRYAADREAFVDLTDGKTVYTQVPMSSLTLVPEKGTKTY